MVCMHTDNQSTNERLRELVKGARLSQPAALMLFNRGLGVRGLKESTWKGYFCKPGTARYRGFDPAFLEHAEKVFGPLQQSSERSQI